MLSLLSKLVGVVFMLLALIVYLSGQFDSGSSPWAVSIFTPGAIGSMLNWLFVAILATIGWGFFTCWKFSLK